MDLDYLLTMTCPFTLANGHKESSAILLLFTSAMASIYMVNGKIMNLMDSMCSGLAIQWYLDSLKMVQWLTRY